MSRYLYTFTVLTLLCSLSAHATEFYTYSLVMRNAFEPNGECKLLSWDEKGLPDYYGNHKNLNARSTCTVKIKNKHNINMCFLTGVEAETTGHSFKCGFQLNHLNELEFYGDISKNTLQRIDVLPRVIYCKYTCGSFVTR